MRGLVGWGERHQVLLYLAAIAAGAGVGLAVPGIAPALGAGVTPVLALLLYATFLGVPFASVGGALADRRFLVAVVGVNFLAIPALAYAVSRFVAHDAAVLVGVLLVLLTPCVDYVIVFAGLAGGARDRLVAATPLLMVLQLVTLPVFLVVFTGRDVAGAIDAGPFVEAFVVLVVLPLGAAALTQMLAIRAPGARRVERAVTGAMVPLMMLTLALVVGSQVWAVSGRWPVLAALVPLYAGFAVAAAVVGGIAGRLLRLDVAERRAVVFSAATRNSLVVLPLALALPAPFDLAPLVVVTQTLVELLVLVGMVAVVPRVVR